MSDTTFIYIIAGNPVEESEIIYKTFAGHTQGCKGAYNKDEERDEFKYCPYCGQYLKKKIRKIHSAFENALDESGEYLITFDIDGEEYEVKLLKSYDYEREQYYCGLVLAYTHDDDSGSKIDNIEKNLSIAKTLLEQINLYNAETFGVYLVPNNSYFWIK